MMATVCETHVGASSELLENSEPQERHSGDDASDGGIEGGGSEEGGTDGEGSEDAGSDVVLSEEGGSDGDQAEDDDGGSSGVEEDEKTKEEEDGNPNAGWAEAMAKILQKKTSVDKPSILTKNKQLDKIKEKERKEQQERKKQVDKRHAWEMMCREKPDVSKDRETERTLQKIATRGVVQLFNAVRTHQKTVSEKVKEVGGSERKKAKLLSSISKKDFISVLRGTDGAEVVVKTEKPTAPEERPAWSVLRDDFMMGASMKNWDQESEEEEGAGGAAGDSDSGSD